MFPTLQTVVRSSFSRDDGIQVSGCSPPLFSEKHTATLNRTLQDLTAAISGNSVLDTFRRGGAQVLELLHPKSGSEMTPQDGSHPFGYEFQENFPESGIAPPSGNEPLLNLQEHNFLANFWSNATGHTTANDFNALNQLSSTSDTNGFSWQMLMNEPPPTVRDIAAASHPQTHVPQHPHSISPHMSLAESQLILGTSGVVDASALLSHSQANHNVGRPLHDAPTLSPQYQLSRNQNGSTQHQRTYQSGIPHVAPAVTQSPIMPGSLKMEPVHTQDALIGITSPTDIESLRASAQSGMLSALPSLQTSNMTNMAFAVPQSAPAADRLDQSVNPRLYHFGSDNNFNAGGFQPSSDFERHEYRAELLSSELRRLKPINRTPVATREHSPELQDVKKQNGVEHEFLNSKTDSVVDNGRKRKRSHDSVSESESDDGGATTTPVKKQRRASGPAATRPKRENLSEVQKRQNHIASEQKRRAQIKLGFDELNRLVPEIRDSGLSKSGMLMEACNFLEQLQAQNLKMSHRLQRIAVE